IEEGSKLLLPQRKRGKARDAPALTSGAEIVGRRPDSCIGDIVFRLAPRGGAARRLSDSHVEIRPDPPASLPRAARRSRKLDVRQPLQPFVKGDLFSVLAAELLNGLALRRAIVLRPGGPFSLKTVRHHLQRDRVEKRVQGQHLTALGPEALKCVKQILAVSASRAPVLPQAT